MATIIIANGKVSTDFLEVRYSSNKLSDGSCHVSPDVEWSLNLHSIRKNEFAYSEDLSDLVMEEENLLLPFVATFNKNIASYKHMTSLRFVKDRTFNAFLLSCVKKKAVSIIIVEQDDFEYYSEIIKKYSDGLKNKTLLVKLGEYPYRSPRIPDEDTDVGLENIVYVK